MTWQATSTRSYQLLRATLHAHMPRDAVNHPWKVRLHILEAGPLNRCLFSSTPPRPRELFNGVKDRKRLTCRLEKGCLLSYTECPLRVRAKVTRLPCTQGTPVHEYDLPYLEANHENLWPVALVPPSQEVGTDWIVVHRILNLRFWSPET